MSNQESSLLRLKQICLVAADLDPVEEELKAILGLEVAYSDPGLSQFGLRNIMLPIGNSFSNAAAAMAATWSSCSAATWRR
jgi:hypothetical protein